MSYINDPRGMGVLSIRGGRDIFQNDEFLHQVFLNLDVKNVVRVQIVSKSFVKVGRSNLLWEEILKQPKKYFSKDLLHYSDFERLDTRSGNIFSKVEYEIKRSFFQSMKVKGKAESDVDYDSREKLQNALSTFTFFFFFILIGAVSIISPPCGILVQGMVACLKISEFDSRETKESWLPIGSTLDVIGSTILTLCGCFSFCLPCFMIQFLSSCCFCCGCCVIPCCIHSALASFICGCCIHGPNYSFNHMLLWLGRFYFFDEVGADPIAELYTSPSIWVLGSILGHNKING